MILAIDPGNIKSAYILTNNDLMPMSFEIVENEEIFSVIFSLAKGNQVAIERVASYGMAVGQEIFDTVEWAGRFHQAALQVGCGSVTRIFRKQVKENLCHSLRAKDTNIRQALLDRFGVVGTKKNPGWFYGFKKDIWAAYAVAVTYHDMFRNAKAVG